MPTKLHLAKSRALLTQKLRDFFTSQNFTEVETPIMVPIPGMEPHLTPFETNLNLPSSFEAATITATQTTTKTIPGDNAQPHIPLYLNTSPELQMKKLLAQNFGNIFTIIKNFRNGEIGGPLHNPEFTMVEWYRENASYTDIMTDCENLVLELAKTTTLTYQSTTIDLTPPWPRLSTHEAFLKYCDIDLLANQTFEDFKKTATAKDFDTNGCETWDDIYFKIFLNHIEPKLGKADQTSVTTNPNEPPTSKPVFLYDYPSTQAALAKKSTKNPFFAERFELYIAGIELANAFSELTDQHEQRERLQEEQNLRRQLGKTIFSIDEEFLKALDEIKNPAAGIALGLDRLLMILLNKNIIDDVLLFPLQKLLKDLE